MASRLRVRAVRTVRAVRVVRAVRAVRGKGGEREEEEEEEGGESIEVEVEGKEEGEGIEGIEGEQEHTRILVGTTKGRVTHDESDGNRGITTNPNIVECDACVVGKDCNLHITFDVYVITC